MKRALVLLLLFLLGACRQQVKVYVGGTFQQDAQGRYVAYGVDTVWVACKPFRDVTYSELRIDGVLVDVDTFPGPLSNNYVWDVSQLPESSMHILQGKAISGSREYLSADRQIWVGFRSRLAVKGPSTERSLWIYCPDGTTAGGLKLDTAYPLCPRLGPGSGSIVFIADHELYRASLSAHGESGQPRLLAQVPNGIYSCDASPVSDLVAFEGYPAAMAHLFTVDSFRNKTQLTHDSDYIIIDSSRFTCIENSAPVFSPDGMRIAYFRRSKCLVPGDPHHDETRRDAFVMNSNGTNPVNLTAGVDDADFSSFTWTFDGKWVLFRVGNGHNAHGVCAANLSGNAITGLTIPSAAVACSPNDSTLIYPDPEYGDRPMFWKKLTWTSDTIYADTGALPVGRGACAYSDHVDWVRFSKR